MRLVVRFAGVVTALVASALAYQPRAQPAGPSFAQMLRAVPAPVSPERLFTAVPVLAFDRLDLLAASRGPASEPGTTRLDRLRGTITTGLNLTSLGRALVFAPSWPETVGFDLDAVDAVLAAPAAAGNLPTSTLIVLAGAPRLHDAARIGGTLLARGFVRDDVNSAIVMRRGDDNSMDPRRRTRGDPFETGLGGSQRVAITPGGLLEAAETSVIQRALDTAMGRRPSLADSAGMQAVLAGLAGTEVVQAIVLAPPAGMGIRVSPQGPGGSIPPRPGSGGPLLPHWTLAALAQVTGPDGQLRHLAVVVLPDAEQARTALQARIQAAATGDRPLPITSVDVHALPEHFNGLGVLVATMRLAPGTGAGATPLVRWWDDIKLGTTMPLTFGDAGVDRQL